MREELIGKNIRIARKNKGWSQTDLSRACGINNTTISAYENGKKLPGLITLASMAQALSVSIDELYYGNANETFLTSAGDDARKIVNSFVMLCDLQVIEVTKRSAYGGLSCFISLYPDAIERLIKALADYKENAITYSDPDLFLEQIKTSAVAMINQAIDAGETEPFMDPEFPSGFPF